ncbi:hypothetical protein OXIME_001286 [Oxyplasma meridianum]|uniref:DUF1616 domain-containing protein n=1 Tax=Oxyplasma meridianum TaxID=3073602 RepID=A0AAX4NH77_9ARCH
MAKKPEEPLFVEPEFNEREFLETEKDRAKSTIVVFLIGALLGILSAYLDLLGYAYLSVLLIIVFILFIAKMLQAMNIRIPKRTSHKFYTYAVLFFSWLIFWIIFLNAPFHTLTGPQFTSLEYDNSGTWTAVPNHSGTYNVPSGPVSYKMYAYYIHPFNVTMNYVPAGGTSPISISSNLHNNYLYFNLTGNAGTTYDVYIHWYSNSNVKQTPFELTISVS